MKENVNEKESVKIHVKGFELIFVGKTPLRVFEVAKLTAATRAQANDLPC